DKIDGAVRTLIEAALARAVSVLAERRDALDNAARVLLQKETLHESELRSLFHSATPPA
ncbi:MAG: hypothetical protein KGJ55_03540, partial [Gammaproteobacteria bacterium]|nr:hypothetical protein [Gammaproteobacteria bacterium]